VLAILAMLARNSALRVAPGGSAPPIPSAPRRGCGTSGRDGKADALIEPKSSLSARTGEPPLLCSEQMAVRELNPRRDRDQAIPLWTQMGLRRYNFARLSRRST
jgi:hypothetical protein